MDDIDSNCDLTPKESTQGFSGHMTKHTCEIPLMDQSNVQHGLSIPCFINRLKPTTVGRAALHLDILAIGFGTA
jgi:hypothetical protein